MPIRAILSRWNFGKAILFKPEDPLKPRDSVFDEAWHAQTLALADTLVRAGHFSAHDWAGALGAALATAGQNGAPDTQETYYHAALSALETLTARHTELADKDLKKRKSAWEKAYLNTPHGKPVRLGAGE